MSDKLDRFTERARRTLTLAQEEALRLQHGYIGTEHLLLGLVRGENNMAIEVLRELGVEPTQVILAVERTVGRGEQFPARKPLLVAQTKRVIELAVHEARLMGHDFIGTEHLLLGLLREGNNTAVQVLRELDIQLDRVVRTHTVRTILQTQLRYRQIHLSRTAAIDPLAHDLTAAAKAGRFDPLIGRERELERLIQILGRRTKRNPLLVGEPGVGKRALVKGLAQRIVEGQVPPSLLNRRLLALDVDNLITHAVYRSLVEERLQQVLDACTVGGDLLFIDRMHTLVGAAGSNVEIANRVKLGLSRGELQVIGATTPGRYDKQIDTEVARDWHLQPILLEEPSPAETVAILQGVKARYEQHHQLLITEEAILAAVELSVRYMTDRFLPDKAIDLVDEAGSWVWMDRVPDAHQLRELFLELNRVREQRDVALENRRLEEVAELRRRAEELTSKIGELRAGSRAVDNLPTVTAEDIATMVAQWTGAAVGHLDPKEETGGHDAGEGESSPDMQPN